MPIAALLGWLIKTAAFAAAGWGVDKLVSGWQEKKQDKTKEGLERQIKQQREMNRQMRSDAAVLTLNQDASAKYAMAVNKRNAQQAGEAEAKAKRDAAMDAGSAAMYQVFMQKLLEGMPMPGTGAVGPMQPAEAPSPATAALGSPSAVAPERMAALQMFDRRASQTPPTDLVDLASRVGYGSELEEYGEYA